MNDTLLYVVAAVIVLGIAAQWLSWRLKVPSILALLVIGIVAGPVTGLLRPDEMFGDILFPMVSLGVALVLFEGGLTLRLGDLRGHGAAVSNLETQICAVRANLSRTESPVACDTLL